MISASEQTSGTKGERKVELRRESGTRKDPSSDSWVDAVVTLLATVLFGLGWALVEIERADPPRDRYDAALSGAWSGAVASAIDVRVKTREDSPGFASLNQPSGNRWGNQDRWTTLALQRSKP